MGEWTGLKVCLKNVFFLLHAIAYNGDLMWLAGGNVIYLQRYYIEEKRF